MSWFARLFARREIAERDALRGQVQRLRGERQRLRASYDVAQTTRINENLWASVGTDAEPSAAVRKTIRQRAGYEIKNNSYACGMIQTRAADVVGRGPRLQLLTLDDVGNEQTEKAFSAWADEIKLGQKLTLAEIQQTQAGEAFLQLTTNPALKSPIKLDVTVLGAERVTTSTQKAFSAPGNYCDGIQYDSNGNPVSYDILDTAPSGNALTYFVDPSLVTTWPASQIVHLYQAIRPAQLRGTSELASCLELFGELRRYTLAVLTAAETAADVAGVLKSQGSATGIVPTPLDALDEIDLARGMITTLPQGWDLGQITAEQPSTGYAEFKREVLNEIARCLGMPLNIALANSAGYNYASGRLDHQVYFKMIRIRQANLARNALWPILQTWTREAILAGQIPVMATAAAHDWFWDGFEHVDPLKEANAQKVRLAIGTTTKAREYGKEGLDWQAQLIQRAREKAFEQQALEDAGLAPDEEESPQDIPDEESQQGVA